ncbi:MAG: flagellin [Bacteriovoracaceae bacterium]|jgi:flagellin|nr:flagellin FliC [Halobacteriovoraceae bacterium]MDP7322293.1 flagellin [Bacteriovoracaceae bacterium]|tara:strand:- start:576 stop:1409 length:834 start_codon:yes stop_codon:yes gene_type:complete
MGFRIATNVASLNAQRSLSRISQQEQTTSAQLSSGERITKSSDDSAGLAISEKLRANIRSSRQANRNANDGISMIQVAEGGLDESANILIRLRELAIQSASDTVGKTERNYTNMEFSQLKNELQRISQTTEFNEVKLLDGSSEKLDFQIGANNDQFEDRIVYDPGKINSGLDALGLSDEAVDSKEGAQNSLEKIDSAIKTVSGQRAELGALQNRLITTSANLETSVENMSAANSRIRDVDYAEATAKNTQNNIMKQAGISVLTQANQTPQQALRLIG